MKKSIFIMAIAISAILTVHTIAYGAEGCGCSKGKAAEGASVDATTKASAEAVAPKVVEIVGNKICPVMKGEIVEEYAVHVEYKGKVYSFCCPGCIEEFNKDPEKYVRIVEEMLKEEK